MINNTMTPTGNYKRAVGVFKNRRDLEDAIRALKDSNYDMERVSLIARHIEDVKGADEVTTGNEAKEGAAAGATAGTVLGGLGGFLVGVGLLAVPGVGPILAAGAEISAIASTLAGAGIGAASGGIIGALVGLGIPEENAKAYNNRVEAGDYLLMVSGTDDDLRRAESILRDRHIEDFHIYNAPDLNTRPVAKTDRVAQRDVAVDRNATATRDLDKDGDAEVLIVDKRDRTL